ncbi:hypothetical protein [Paraburkholderia sp. 32]
MRKARRCSCIRSGCVGGRLPLNADARVCIAALRDGVTVHQRLLSRHKAYLVTDHGRIDVEDGVAVSGEPSVSIRARDDTDVLLVELLRKR